MREQRSGLTEGGGGRKDALTEIHRLVAFWTFGRHDPAETKRRGGRLRSLRRRSLRLCAARTHLTGRAVMETLVVVMVVVEVVVM